jgi:hypothetical protein
MLLVKLGVDGQSISNKLRERKKRKYQHVSSYYIDPLVGLSSAGNMSREKTTQKIQFVSQSSVNPIRSVFDLVVPRTYSFHIQSWTSDADSPVGRVSSRGKGSTVFMLINKLLV